MLPSCRQHAVDVRQHEQPSDNVDKWKQVLGRGRTRPGMKGLAGALRGEGNGRASHCSLAFIGILAIIITTITFVADPMVRRSQRAQVPMPQHIYHIVRQTHLNNGMRDALTSSCSKSKSGRSVLVTGAAGFIGFHVSQGLFQQGDVVVGVDNFNDYYPVSLKRARQVELRKQGILVVEGDLNDISLLSEVFAMCNFTHVVHLAAQAGVRYAARNPMSYVQSNIAATVALMEVIKSQPRLPAVVYASSSSIYGLSKHIPFSEQDRVDNPASLYAASKISTELICHVYHHLYHLSMTGLRFFTVYGPWGRPDMSYMSFTRSILKGKQITVFQGPGQTELARDFTYIADIVSGIGRALNATPASTPSSAWFRVFNLGNTHPVTVTALVRALEKALKLKAMIQYKPLPNLGEVLKTHANISAARQVFEYDPQTDLEDGARHVVEWYKSYYGADGTQMAADELMYKPD